LIEQQYNPCRYTISVDTYDNIKVDIYDNIKEETLRFDNFPDAVDYMTREKDTSIVEEIDLSNIDELGAEIVKMIRERDLSLPEINTLFNYIRSYIWER